MCAYLILAAAALARIRTSWALLLAPIALQAAWTQPAPQTDNGSIHGVVMDRSGSVCEGARVLLIVAGDRGA